MTLTARFELLLLLMVAIIGLELLARRLRLPTAGAFIVGGAALALIPGIPDFELDPDLVLMLVLPPLLMAGGYLTVWRDFRANLRAIVQLAVGAVAFTTLVIGVVAHWVVPTLPWAACFALGAIVAPPDAVAAKAVLQRLRLPPRMIVLLEGESLVNDATGLVLYRIAVAAAATGSFNAGEAALSFIVLAVGGVVTGIAFGYLSGLGCRLLREPHLVIVFSWLAAWGSYIAGEALGVSGVLSTVACGLVAGWQQHEILSAETRTSARIVWQVVGFVLESLVFMLIGFSLRGVLHRLETNEARVLAELLLVAGAVVAAVIAARFAWIFPVIFLPRALFRSVRRREPAPPLAVPVIMSWAGMRGVVSLAAALALPDEFPGHDVILAVTFAVILATVLVQGATLGPLIRVLGVSGIVPDKTTTLSEAEARKRVAEAQQAAVAKLSHAPDGTERHPRLLEQYTYRARAAARFAEASATLTSSRTEHFIVVLAAIKAGRAEALRMHRAGVIHDSVLHELERGLDLDEMSARRFVAEDH